MIVQAIVALLQQAPEIDRATVRSSSFIARPPITSCRVSGGSIFHAAEQSGEPKFLPSTFGRLIGGLLFRGTGSARGRRKNISRVDRRPRRGLAAIVFLQYCLDVQRGSQRSIFPMTTSVSLGQRGAQMAQRQQPPWWWRSEMLGQVAMALLAAVATYLARVLDLILSLKSP